MTKDKQLGFTIVELLIVIVVIGILAAITIVSFSGVQDKARAAAGKSFAAQIKHRDFADAVGFWGFDECSGSTYTNTAGSATSQTGAAVGPMAYSTDTPSGTGCSLSLAGSSYLGLNIGLSNTYYSKSLWIKTSSGASAMNMISDLNGGSQNSAFYLDTQHPSAGHNGVWNAVSNAAQLNDNKWHFMFNEFKVNASGTSGTMTLSVDGATVSTNTNVPLMTSPANVQGLGTFGAGSNFVGLVDEVMLVVK